MQQLKDVILKTPFKRIEKDLSKFFKKGRKTKSLRAYRILYSNLKRKRAKPSDVVICFKKRGKECWEVYGKSATTGQEFALDYSTFSDWLGFNLQRVPLSLEQALSAILWEMTFYGLTDSKIYKERRTLRRLLKERRR